MAARLNACLHHRDAVADDWLDDHVIMTVLTGALRDAIDRVPQMFFICKSLFNQAVLQSFETTWLAAAFGSVVGLILALFTLVFRRKKAVMQQSSEPVLEVDVPVAL